jgi:hypothetical protein
VEGTRESKIYKRKKEIDEREQGREGERVR